MDPVPPPVTSTPDSYGQALRRLISGAVPQDDLVPLIETIFSDERVADMVDSLRGDEVQTLVDVIDVVCHHAPPSSENALFDLRFNLRIRRWILSISYHRSEEIA